MSDSGRPPIIVERIARAIWRPPEPQSFDLLPPAEREPLFDQARSALRATMRPPGISEEDWRRLMDLATEGLESFA